MKDVFPKCTITELLPGKIKMKPMKFNFMLESSKKMLTFLSEDAYVLIERC